MKTMVLLRSVIIIPGILLMMLYSCSVTNMTVDVFEPPAFPLPDSIKSLGLVTRLGQVESGNIDKLVEGIFSGQGSYVNSIGAYQAVMGIYNYLDYSQEFDKVARIRLEKADTGWSAMPPPLLPEQLEELKKTEKIDALISIDYFVPCHHSYIEKRRERIKKKEEDLSRGNIAYSVETQDKYISVLEVCVESGWRIYNLLSGGLSGEKTCMDSVIWESSGYSEKDALAKLPNRSRAVEDAGFMVGERFGSGIVPGWSTVSRSFYILHARPMKGSVKKLRHRLWGELSDQWEEASLSSDPKTRAAALFNLAVLSEMNGDIARSECLLEASRKAFLLRHTPDYLEIIRQRRNNFHEPLP